MACSPPTKIGTWERRPDRTEDRRHVGPLLRKHDRDADTLHVGRDASDDLGNRQALRDEQRVALGCRAVGASPSASITLTMAGRLERGRDIGRTQRRDDRNAVGVQR